MIIESGKVVSFHYKMTEVGSDYAEDSHSSDPMVYLHGHGGMIFGLEEGLAGKKAGDQFSITLEPDKAYGPRNEGQVQRVPIKHLRNKGKLKVGQVITLNTEQGSHDAIILKVGRFVVDVDTNHPLAGKTLKFDIEVEDVRGATTEELEHGHVHGPGGHHH